MTQRKAVLRFLAILASFAVAYAPDPQVHLDSTSIATTEDVVVGVSLTPDIQGQAYDETRFLHWSNLPSGITFASLNGYSSKLLGTVYTLTEGSGALSFTDTNLITVPTSAPVDCDIDFTLSIKLWGQDGGWGFSVVETVAVVVFAEADASTIQAVSATATSEDVATVIRITPASGPDTDESEKPALLFMTHISAVSRLPGISGTSSVVSPNEYTLQHDGTGFSHNTAISQLSVSASEECDIDFTLSFRIG
eukprot:Rmarinus@m.15815